MSAGVSTSVSNVSDRVSAGVSTGLSSASSSRLYRAATEAARKHSRVSMVAASTAAAGMLGVSGFAIGAAPWAQAADNIAATVQNQPQSAQSGAFLFNTISGTSAHSSQTADANHLDVEHSAAPSGVSAVALSGKTALPAVGKPAAAGKAAPSKEATARLTATQAKAAASHAVAAKAAQAKAAVAHAAALKAAAEAKVTAAKPYQIYDSVKPGEIPSGQPAAVYATGSYAASASAVADHKRVLWIDTNGSDPSANALDVEPGDATPSGAASWVHDRLSKDPSGTAIVYTMLSEWQDVKNSVGTLPSWMQSKVKYWIADPTGTQHMVTGASATQWYWGSNYDITTAEPGF